MARFPQTPAETGSHSLPALPLCRVSQYEMTICSAPGASTRRAAWTARRHRELLVRKRSRAGRCHEIRRRIAQLRRQQHHAQYPHSDQWSPQLEFNSWRGRSGKKNGDVQGYLHCFEEHIVRPTGIIDIDGGYGGKSRINSALSEIANKNFRAQVHEFSAQQVPQRRDRRGSLCGFPVVHGPRPADGTPPPHCMAGAPSGRASAVSACGPTGETGFDRTLRNRRGAHGLGIPQIHAFSSLGVPDIAINSQGVKRPLLLLVIERHRPQNMGPMLLRVWTADAG